MPVPWSSAAPPSAGWSRTCCTRGWCGNSIAPTRAGRKPIGLEINASAGQIVGIDVGATHIRAILADIAGRPLAELSTSFDVKVGPEKTLAEVRRLVDRLIRDGESSLAHVRSIGLGVPARSSANGGWCWPRLSCRAGPVPIRHTLEEAGNGRWSSTTTPTWGAGRVDLRCRPTLPNLIFVKVGTGIGIGMILGGRLHEGQVGAAGEIGHLTLVENGPLCSCGNRGCLEALAGGGAIARQRTSLCAGTADPPVHPAVHRPSSPPMWPRPPRKGITWRSSSSPSGRVHRHRPRRGHEHAQPRCGCHRRRRRPVGRPAAGAIRAQIRKRGLQAGVLTCQVTSAWLGLRSSALGAVGQPCRSASTTSSHTPPPGDGICRRRRSGAQPWTRLDDFPSNDDSNDTPSGEDEMKKQLWIA